MYEYRITSCFTDESVTDEKNYLCVYGIDGWELISVIYVPGARLERLPKFKYYWKRQIRVQNTPTPIINPGDKW